MSLVVPIEIRNDINPYSGYINPESKFAKKNLKGLFYTKENQRYLAKELYLMITCEQYVKDNLPDEAIYDIPELHGTHDDPIYGFNNRSSYFDKIKLMIQKFVRCKPRIDQLVFSMIEAHPMPFKEELGILNPVQQLHGVNLDFLTKTAQDIIQNSQNLIPEMGRINPDTGKYETAEYDYDASSYSDGTWHPEHLFTNNTRNRDNVYWEPLEVNIYSDPDAGGRGAAGVGHKYNNIIYNQGTKKYYESKVAYDGSRKGAITKNPQERLNGNSYGQFPGWQTTVNKRFYDRENTLGLKDGGIDDRRTQRPHGYNMKALIKKPTY